MKLYAVYTGGAAILRDGWFLKSLQDNWELHLLQIGKTGEKYGNFSTLEFKNIIKEKNELILTSIKDNSGDTIIWSDLDIQFFGKCSDIINDSMGENDIVFQSERNDTKEVNVGFMVIRCNQKTLEFWRSVLKRINSAEWNQPAVNDQSIINDMLRKGLFEIKYNVLSNRFWAKSHPGEPPQNILLHHANRTAPCVKNGRLIGSMELKIKQLNEIRRLIENKKNSPAYLSAVTRYFKKPLCGLRKIIIRR